MAASFYASPAIGATTTLACFARAREIPHEIADYSTLIRSRFTKRQAIESQFLTAIGAFVSIWIELPAPPIHYSEDSLPSNHETVGIFVGRTSTWTKKVGLLAINYGLDNALQHCSALSPNSNCHLPIMEGMCHTEQCVLLA